jgi:2-polyprenyl-6-hydroxyphenyl methylase/3-demethylubiquinone-9 3-methyltransferase
MTDSSPETAPLTAPPDAFKFGRNWQRYVADHLTAERRDTARRSITDLLGDISGQTFLDIGAGSGLFSACALELGAARIVSLDVDADSVASCRRLREAAGAPDHWQVLEGSILDAAVVERLEPADVVYSWGVLHHTGDMWTAIDNAAKLVKAGGRLCIAIYNDAPGRRLFTTPRWVAIKRSYNHAPRPVQRLMEVGYEAFWWLNQMRRGHNPRRAAAEYRKERGMAVRTDLVDWLGGYPFEYASTDDIVAFCEARGLRTEHVKRLDARDIGNNEFVFTRPDGG